MIKVPVTINDPMPAGNGGEIIGYMEIDETKLPKGAGYVFSPAFIVDLLEKNDPKDAPQVDPYTAELVGVMIINDVDYQPIKHT